jgi:hypothetical protein
MSSLLGTMVIPLYRSEENPIQGTGCLQILFHLFLE